MRNVWKRLLAVLLACAMLAAFAPAISEETAAVEAIPVAGSISEEAKEASCGGCDRRGSGL